MPAYTNLATNILPLHICGEGRGEVMYLSVNDRILRTL